MSRSLRNQVRPLDPRRLGPLIGTERMHTLLETAAATRVLLGGRRIVNINSTANGGGVAEMLATLVAYTTGAGIESEWLVIAGAPEFFTVTKRIHNGLYGGPGDGGELGERERRIYEATIAKNVESILGEVRSGDVVLVHDPQPAGLVAPLLESGTEVVWRCHVGYDGTNEWTERAWDFIRPYVEPARAFVFSREAFAPPWVPRERLSAIPPSLDPFTAKNMELADAEVAGLLAAADLVAPSDVPRDPRVEHPLELVREGSAPGLTTPLVVQVSRWDRMKDMTGVLHGFVDHVSAEAHLVLAGPAVRGVDDDPEGQEVWEETRSAWDGLSREQRSRVHLAAIPTENAVENALVVNALQRHATVVAQKSLAEGFGLTVTEAMWKSRPVVASAVGGIVDQVTHGETGLLVSDPADLASFGNAVDRLLAEPAEAARLGANGRARICQRYLGDRHLLSYAELVRNLLDGR